MALRHGEYFGLAMVQVLVCQVCSEPYHHDRHHHVPHPGDCTLEKLGKVKA